MKYRFPALVLAAFVMFAAPLTVEADEDQDCARRAYEAGEIVDLGQILSRVRSVYPGKVLEIELDCERGSSRAVPWVYTVKLLTPQGDVLKLWLDAKTTRILDVRGRRAGFDREIEKKRKRKKRNKKRRRKD